MSNAESDDSDSRCKWPRADYMRSQMNCKILTSSKNLKTRLIGNMGSLAKNIMGVVKYAVCRVMGSVSVVLC